MTKIKMLIELDYGDRMFDEDEPEEVEWFEQNILLGDSGQLLLHSNELGDSLGPVKVLELHKESKENENVS